MANWDSYQAILDKNAEDRKKWEKGPPRMCPNDGTALQEVDGVYHCPHDGWTWDGMAWSKP